MKKLMITTTIVSLAIGLAIYAGTATNATIDSKDGPPAATSTASTISMEKIEANHAIFVDADDAEKQSDAVVRVIATGENTNILEEFAWGLSGRTETKVKVTEVYKNSPHSEIGSELVVFEPSYVVESPEGNIRWNYEDYTSLQEGKEYILFLVWAEPLNGYWINALKQGKHEVSGEDFAEKSLQTTNQQYAELKKSVLEKYK